MQFSIVQVNASFNIGLHNKYFFDTYHFVAFYTTHKMVHKMLILVIVC